MNRISALSYFVSVILHAVIVFFLPGLGNLEPVFQPKWLEADIIPIPDESIILERKMGTASTDANNNAKKNPSKSVLEERQPFPNPPLNLPDLLSQADSEKLALKNTQPVVNYGAIISDSLDQFPTIFDRNKTEPPAINSDPEGPPAFDWQPAHSDISDMSKNVNSEDMPLQGPVSKRKILFRPSLPEPVATVGGVVSLKFWVHADGTIGKIVPIRRSDPVLEQAAIDFLEKWRFEPVEADAPDQWGILPIRFKLQ